jgi:AcrR family transcriptional regulator
MMMGLLQKRKEKTRKSILQTARRLFLTQGFVNTTMQDVARECELGVGTLYNYFSSKVDLLFAIFSEEMMEVGLELPARVNHEQKLVDKMKQVVDLYLTQLFKSQRSLFRELMVVIFHRLEGYEQLVSRIRETDALFLQVVRNVIEHEKQSGRIPGDWDTEATIEVIYSILQATTIAFISQDELTIEQVKQTIHKQLEFVLRMND